MQVLIAEDDAVSRLMLQSALERWGYEVTAVDGGVAALAALSAPTPPSLALLDWNMPDLTGPEICRRIRQRVDAPYTYIILVTSKARKEDIVVGLEAGADDFIGKPFDPDELRARIRAGRRIMDLQDSVGRTQSYLSVVLENLDDGVLLADSAWQIIFANRALTELAGAGLALNQPRSQLLADVQKQLVDPAALESQAVSSAAQAAPPPVDITFKSEDPRTYRWVTKPVTLAHGVGQLDIVRDVTGERRLAQVLEVRALTDFLTGAANRRAGVEALEREAARARREQTPLSFALFDIDHFKRINDTFGHAAGDEALRSVANTLRQAVRVSDWLVRWGGEEFLLLLPGAAEKDAFQLADRLREKVMRAHPNPPITVSAGVSELQVGAEPPDAAVKRADARLYEAKAAGRNCIR